MQRALVTINFGNVLCANARASFEDAAGRWWIVDYKTNKVTAATVAAAAADYEMQMLVYALAVERVLNRPPDGMVLCFLRPGLEVAFDWNDTARRRAIELVERAMECRLSDRDRGHPS